MSNKKQTAVEWLKERLPSLFSNDDNNFYSQLFEQALQMEREQIKEAWLDAWKESMLNPLPNEYYKPEADQYYNETYGGNK